MDDQNYALGQDNVALGLRLRGLNTAKRRGIAQENRQLVGLEACVRYDALELARPFSSVKFRGGSPSQRRGPGPFRPARLPGLLSRHFFIDRQPQPMHSSKPMLRVCNRAIRSSMPWAGEPVQHLPRPGSNQSSAQTQ